VIALAAIILGLALGAASGGSLRRLQHVKVRHEWLVLAFFAAQAFARGRIAGSTASAFGTTLWALTCVVLLGSLWADWRQPGVWVVCVGLALNLLVVLLNGGMPIALNLETLTGDAAVTIARTLSFYQVAGPETSMAMLGDVVPLSVGAYRVLVSPGDVLLAIGVAVFLANGMTVVRTAGIRTEM